MNLIPTRRGSGQGLYVPLLVGVELANTLRTNRKSAEVQRVCCVRLASRPCSETICTITSLHSLNVKRAYKRGVARPEAMT